MCHTPAHLLEHNHNTPPQYRAQEQHGASTAPGIARWIMNAQYTKVAIRDSVLARGKPVGETPPGGNRKLFGYHQGSIQRPLEFNRDALDLDHAFYARAGLEKPVGWLVGRYRH